MPKEFYTPGEVASLIGASRTTIQRALSDGDLNSTRVGNRHRITLPDLEAWLGKARARRLVVGTAAEVLGRAARGDVTAVEWQRAFDAAEALSDRADLWVESTEAVDWKSSVGEVLAKIRRLANTLYKNMPQSVRDHMQQSDDSEEG